jgi:hypothetical protein
MSSTPTGLDKFVQLSAALTGVSADQLKPQIDPIKIAEQYFAMLTNKMGGQVVGSLFDIFEQQASAVGSDKAAEFVLSDPTLGPVARSIIKMWLLGAWYDPHNPHDSTNNQVVSSQAYKESLVWKVMQSHPMGYSMFAFGYWAQQPPAFDRFINVDPAIDGGTYHG